MWIRNLFECSRNVPIDILYLEMGVIPIKYIIKMRRLMFLKHILKQNEESLLFQFFMAQLKFPTKNDWASQLLEEIDELDIKFELDEIEIMSKI